jgi:CheY-like chemotaxis protein
VGASMVRPGPVPFAGSAHDRTSDVRPAMGPVRCRSGSPIITITGLQDAKMGGSQVPPVFERAREIVLSTKTLISIVDDDQGFRDALTSLIRSLEYRVRAFPSATAFLTSRNVRNTSCLIADIHMPAMTGVELYSRLVESGNTIPTILVTAYPDDGVRARALTAGVICCLDKPFNADELLACIRAALGRANPGEET